MFVAVPKDKGMIKSYNHKGLEDFAKTGSKAGINAEHAEKLIDRLTALDAATEPKQMNQPGWRLHPLKDDLAGHYSVRVTANWRLTFRFEGVDAFDVDLQDYH